MLKGPESVMVLGVAVKRTELPEIFRLAKASPRNLRLVLEGIMLKRGLKDPASAMSLLEGDLGSKRDIPRIINSQAGKCTGRHRPALRARIGIRYTIFRRPTEPLSLTSLIPVGFCFCKVRYAI